MCVTWLIHVYDMTHASQNHRRLVHVCVVAHWCVCHDCCITTPSSYTFVWHDAFICVTWPMRTGAAACMLQQFKCVCMCVCMCVTWLIHHKTIASFMCVTWRMHTGADAYMLQQFNNPDNVKVRRICVNVHVYVNVYLYVYVFVHVCMHVCVCAAIQQSRQRQGAYVYVWIYMCMEVCICTSMGWLRLVGSLKLYVSFGKESYKIIIFCKRDL